MQRRLPGVETTQVEAHVATYCLFATNHQRQVAHRQYKFRSRRWLSVHASGRQGPCLNSTYKRQKFSSCHDFSVKAYVATLKVAALAVGMSMQYLAISGEDLAAYLLV